MYGTSFYINVYEEILRPFNFELQHPDAVDLSDSSIKMLRMGQMTPILSVLATRRVWNTRSRTLGEVTRRMWTPPWLASTTSNEERHVGQVLSYVRPLDAALVGRGPVWFS